MVAILYEDNHIIVVEKPVNMLSQEDDTGDLDLLTYLKEDIKMRYHKPGNVYLGLVHRLDRPVGGAMVFAKTSKAASRLSESIRNRSFAKTYLAILHGQPKLPAGRLVHHLLKDPNSNTVHVVSPKQEHAKEAILDYEVINPSQEGFSLVRIQLLTGRSHQIRVQFSSIGCPLYGDQRYGINAQVKRGYAPKEQIALWSHELTFQHPTLNQQVTFRSIPPRTKPWSLWDIAIQAEI
ncbi:MAG TPA: RluA family pseudouridine synthase [Bacilli bacterium]